MTVALQSLGRCWLGAIPSLLATTSRDGTPNATFISQVFYVDADHVALSCQFFNKTRRNLQENPRACLVVVDPLTFQAYRLDLGLARAETSGPVFDAMALRIQAIASQTGMSDVFRLVSAHVLEVLSVAELEGFVEAGATAGEPGAARTAMDDLARLQRLSARINAATDLEHLLATTLQALEDLFGFSHSMVLVPGDDGSRLVTIASHGYGESGVGAEVGLGEGLLGTAAAERQVIRLSGAGGLRYARAVRDRVAASPARRALRPEIPLPGLPDPQSQMALPLVMRDRLLGVLAIESRDPACFEGWHESSLQILANQIAFAYAALAEAGAGEDGRAGAATPDHRRRRLTYYRNDDCIFADGEYLVRNVPAKILWKLLRTHADEGRTAFSNRELRLDERLGLPAVRQNLESRLILLRRRLAEKCPEIAIVPSGRGRFVLELRCAVDLEEKDSA